MKDQKLTENFDLSEFVAKSGYSIAQISPAQFANLKKLAIALQNLRDQLGKPIKINSALRSPAKNRAVRGASRSQHLYGLAADVQISNEDQKKLKLSQTWKGGYGRGNGWCHLDVRPNKARWSY